MTMRKSKEQLPPPRPQDEFETEADRLLAYAQYVADTKCGAVDLGDYYYEYSGDITLLIQSNKVTAHNMKTDTVVIAQPKQISEEEWANAIR